MHAKIDHVAIKAADFDKAVNFFEEVFEMEVEKKEGTAPMRKVWFREGIQVNEVSTDVLQGGIMDHIGIKTDFKEVILQKGVRFGCRKLPNGENWMETPIGIVIELK